MTFDHPQKMRYLASMEYGIAAAWDVIQDSEQEVVMECLLIYKREWKFVLMNEILKSSEQEAFSLNFL